MKEKLLINMGGNKAPQALTTEIVSFRCKHVWIRNVNVVATVGAINKQAVVRLWMIPDFSSSFFSCLLRAER